MEKKGEGEETSSGDKLHMKHIYLFSVGFPEKYVNMYIYHGNF